MNRRLLPSVAAAAAVFALVASPALAAAKPPPAYNIYVEQLPTASGPKATGGTGGTATGGPTGQTIPTVPLSPTATTILKREGGKDKPLLKKVATSPELGAHRVVASGAPNQQPPSALDLGSGPNTLFVALLVGAALLALGGGLRHRRRSR